MHSGWVGTGYRHHPTRWGVSAGTSRTTQQRDTVGSLIISMFETDGKQLVWEGSASGTLDSSSGREEQVNEVVQGILRDFPPGSDDR